MQRMILEFGYMEYSNIFRSNKGQNPRTFEMPEKPLIREYKRGNMKNSQITTKYAMIPAREEYDPLELPVVEEVVE